VIIALYKSTLYLTLPYLTLLSIIPSLFGRIECIRCKLLQLVCACLSCGRLCKTAERIEVLLGAETLGDPRNVVLDGGPQGSMRPLPNYFGYLFIVILHPVCRPIVLYCSRHLVNNDRTFLDYFS